MGTIQNIIKKYFKLKKHLIFTRSILEDITDPQRQFDIIKSEHDRAHRGIQENYAQIKKRFFWPSMLHDIKNFINSCKTCKTYKYDRNPPKNVMGKSPIPEQPGEIVHIDIFQMFKQSFISSICKLTKFASLIPIKSKAIEDVKGPLMELIFKYRKPGTIVVDNEPAFQSFSIENLFRNLDINLFTFLI
jgi:Integrase zinc binding domain